MHLSHDTRRYDFAGNVGTGAFSFGPPSGGPPPQVSGEEGGGGGLFSGGRFNVADPPVRELVILAACACVAIVNFCTILLFVCYVWRNCTAQGCKRGLGCREVGHCLTCQQRKDGSGIITRWKWQRRVKKQQKQQHEKAALRRASQRSHHTPNRGKQPGATKWKAQHHQPANRDRGRPVADPRDHEYEEAVSGATPTHNRSLTPTILTINPAGGDGDDRMENSNLYYSTICHDTLNATSTNASQIASIIGGANSSLLSLAPPHLTSIPISYPPGMMTNHPQLSYPPTTHQRPNLSRYHSVSSFDPSLLTTSLSLSGYYVDPAAADYLKSGRTPATGQQPSSQFPPKPTITAAREIVNRISTSNTNSAPLPLPPVNRHLKPNKITLQQSQEPKVSNPDSDESSRENRHHIPKHRGSPNKSPTKQPETGLTGGKLQGMSKHVVQSRSRDSPRGSGRLKHQHRSSKRQDHKRPSRKAHTAAMSPLADNLHPRNTSSSDQTRLSRSQLAQQSNNVRSTNLTGTRREFRRSHSSNLELHRRRQQRRRNRSSSLHRQKPPPLTPQQTGSTGRPRAQRYFRKGETTADWPLKSYSLTDLAHQGESELIRPLTPSSTEPLQIGAAGPGGQNTGTATILSHHAFTHRHSRNQGSTRKHRDNQPQSPSTVAPPPLKPQYIDGVGSTGDPIPMILPVSGSSSNSESLLQVCGNGATPASFADVAAVAAMSSTDEGFCTTTSCTTELEGTRISLSRTNSHRVSSTSQVCGSSRLEKRISSASARLEQNGVVDDLSLSRKIGMYYDPQRIGKDRFLTMLEIK